MSAKPVDISGRCLCGAVTFTAQTPSRHFGVCHCGQCRKWGSGAYLEVECGNSVKFTGEDNIGVYQSSEWAERGFCKTCGSNLFYRLKETGSTSVSAGLIDDMTGFTMIAQVCIDSKPDYYSFAQETKEYTCQEMFDLFGGDKDT